MPCAFSGDPYYAVDFVGATSSIMIEAMTDNFELSGWEIADVISAWAQAHPVTQPANNETVKVGSTTYTFKTAAATSLQIQIGATLIDTVNNLIAKVNAGGVAGMTYDAATGYIRASHRYSGSIGNGTTMLGWPGWASDPEYGAPANALWMGGYKWRTSSRFKVNDLPNIPSICYVFDSNTFSFGGILYGAGYTSSASFQFMSADESTKGGLHLVGCGPGATMRYIGSPGHFFMYRTNKVSDSIGSTICGGSYYTPYVLGDPPIDAWYSMGDYFGSPFGYGRTPRTGLITGGGTIPSPRACEICYDGKYSGFGTGQGVARIILRLEPDSPQEDPAANGMRIEKVNGDPFAWEPFLVSGDDNSDAHAFIRGQMYDAMIVSKAFPTAYTGAQLAETYPWSNGATRPDGLPKNRLAPDFDQCDWLNVTDEYRYGSLFLVSSLPAFMGGKVNYVYEGKA